MRFAAVATDCSSRDDVGSVRIYDADGRQLVAVAGTDGAQQVLWLPNGIVFTRGTRASEIMLVPPTGGLAVSLYQDAAHVVIRAVAVP